ncbi:MAG: hypothetical protein Q9220_003571 [cf. Caloplaca sp. 1 TL-2023]
MNLGSDSLGYNETSEVLKSRMNYQYYWRKKPNRPQYAFRFNELNPKDKQKAYPFFTDRIITVDALDCITYSETSEDDKCSRTFTYKNEKSTGNITIPHEYLGLEGTTYIYRGHNVPAAATSPDVVCGDRCIWMWAYKNPSGSHEPSAFYRCPVNVSMVQKANVPEHDIPNNVARLAAAAIAMQGRWAGPFDNQDHTQHQSYAAGSHWDIHNATADEVGAKFAEFALGALATMASTNPPVQVLGHLPHLGHKLQVYEPYFAIIWSCIVGTHCIVSAVTIYYAMSEYRATGTSIPLGDVDPHNESQENLVR